MTTEMSDYLKDKEDRIEELERELEDLQIEFNEMDGRHCTEYNELREERDQLRQQLSKYVAQLDDMHGTPCEQVRHKQEVDELKDALDEHWKAIGEFQAENERLRDAIDNCYPGNRCRQALNPTQDGR